jgi:hypothetical protein
MESSQIELLKSVGAVPEGQYFANPKTMADAEKAGLVEGNKGIKNPNDKTEHAYRLTPAGHQAIADADATNADEGDTDGFTIIDVAAIPPVGRLNSGQSKYPFDKLKNGQAFFIPAPADMKSPSKSFGSLVSSANKRFGDPNGDFRHFTTRSTMGDAFGKPGVRGVAIYRETVDAEAKSKAKAAEAAK